MISRLGTPPHEGRVRVFLIEEATALQGPAANALLKTLEEPPNRTHFVLITTAPRKLLPTVRSRCQRVTFAPLAPDVRAQLAAIDHDDADNTAEALRDATQAFDEAVSGPDLATVFQAAAAIAQEKANILPTLHQYCHLLRDRARDAAVSGDRTAAVALVRQTRAILEAETALTMHNAHGQLVLERLIHELRESAHHTNDRRSQ